MTRPFLIGDIGGSRIRLALANHSDFWQVENTLCPEAKSPDEIILAYLERIAPDQRPLRAVFGVAGAIAERGDRQVIPQGDRPTQKASEKNSPIQNGPEQDHLEQEVYIVNRDWHLSTAQMAQKYNLQNVKLINDLAAIAWSIGSLPEEGWTSFSPHDYEDRPFSYPKISAILGLGTGVGVASLYRDGKYHHVTTSEGGHATLPAITPLQKEILTTASKSLGHVSIEKMLCGQGLVRIYQALCEIADEPNLYDDPHLVQKHAESDHLCRRALHCTNEWIGIVAGNIALQFGINDAVYLTGGVSEHLRPDLNATTLWQNFIQKGRMQSWLTRRDFRLITMHQTALHGLVHYIHHHCSELS